MSFLLGASGGSAGSIGVGINLYLKDNFSGPASRVKQAMDGVSKEYTAFQDNLRSARNISAGTAAAFAGLAYGIGGAIKEGADFHYMLRSVQAVADATNQELEMLTKQAIDLGRSTMFFPKDIGSGMRFMAMAGQDAMTINKTIEASTNLAGATLTQLGGKMGAADILTNALKAFGWEAERSAEMSDILVLATNNANVSLTDMGNSIRYAAATSRNLKVPVQETAALLMSLGNAGIQASMAGVAVENMLRYLGLSLSEFASKRSQASWATFGIDPKSIQDAQGNLIPIPEILRKIKKGAEGLGSVEIQNALTGIFGVRGQRAAGTLLNNLDEASGFIDLLNDPTQAGVAGEKMALMMDSLQGAIWRVQSAWKGLQATFAKSTEGFLKPLLDGVNWLVIAFDKLVSTKVGGFLSTLFVSIVGFGTVLWGVRAAALAVFYSFRTLNVGYKSMAASATLVKQILTGKIAAYGALTTAANASAVAQARSASAGLGAALTRTNYSQYSKDGKTFLIPRGKDGKFMSPGKNPQALPKGSTLAAGVKGAAVGSGVARVGVAARSVGALAFVGRGLLAVLGGPVMTGIMVVTAFLPMIISAFSGNTKAVRENTEAIKAASMKAINKEHWEVIKNRKLEEVANSVSTNLVRLIEQGATSHRELTDILESGDVRKIGALLAGLSLKGSDALGGLDIFYKD